MTTPRNGTRLWLLALLTTIVLATVGYWGKTLSARTETLDAISRAMGTEVAALKARNEFVFLRLERIEAKLDYLIERQAR